MDSLLAELPLNYITIVLKLWTVDYLGRKELLECRKHEITGEKKKKANTGKFEDGQQISRQPKKFWSIYLIEITDMY